MTIEITMQFTLFGGEALPPMSDHEKVLRLLELYPETRNDDRRLMVMYWAEYDALETVFKTPEQMAAFEAWFCNRRTTAPESIRRRRAEIQPNEVPGAGALVPERGEADRLRCGSAWDSSLCPGRADPTETGIHCGNHQTDRTLGDANSAWRCLRAK